MIWPPANGLTIQNFCVPTTKAEIVSMLSSSSTDFQLITVMLYRTDKKKGQDRSNDYKSNWKTVKKNRGSCQMVVYILTVGKKHLKMLTNKIFVSKAKCTI